MINHELLAFIGGTEILIVGGVALVLFGAKKLPEIGKGLALGIREFKEGMRAREDQPKDPEAAPESTQKLEEKTKPATDTTGA